MRTFLKLTGLYIGFTLLLVPYALLTGLPRPQSAGGWAALLLLALPASMAVEYAGDRLLGRNPVARAVERRTRGKQFSWLRIAFALVAMLAFLGAMFGIGVLLGR